MPYVEPSNLLDIPKAQRSRLRALMFERAVMGYSFSYKALTKLLSKLGSEDPDADLKSCLIAINDKDEKAAKDLLNDEISGIYTENDIKSLRDEDPFGNKRDYLLYESSTSVFSKDRAVEIAMSKYGISAKRMKDIFEAATEKRPYVAFTVREVKEKPEENSK